MGIVNITPDSFSDGGRYMAFDRALAYARQCIQDGASVIDVGGESTRPGAVAVSSEQEMERVVPLIEAISSDVRVSVDTTKAEIAHAAVDAGATIINDVSASLDDVAAQRGVGWVAMHRQGSPATMQDNPTYEDIVLEVTDYLMNCADRAKQKGVTEIWVDPGIGFGKTTEHNLILLANIGRLVEKDIPVVIGASRKRFLGDILAASDGMSLMDEKNQIKKIDLVGKQDVIPEPSDRLEGSLSIAVWAMQQGVSMVRAHDVLATAQAAKLVGVRR